LAPPDSTAGSASVDAQHPWLGLDSFTEETRAYFYGRDEEVAELARRVQRKLLTILFGQSGLGKTSILRAGIVPRLRAQGYCPVYVRIDYSPDSRAPSQQIKDAILRATQRSGQWSQPGVAIAGESLWEFLHHRDDVLRDASGRTVIPLLIFDQFEEIFTLAQSDEFGRQRAAEFLEDLADLVENRPPDALEVRLEHDDSVVERFDFTRGDYRILIALREDYLAHLEGVKTIMPSITQNRMRLARMTGPQALDAVLKPGGRLVNQEVAESIVRFTAGGSELRNAEVEPSLLSLICRELNNARIAQGRAEISADLLAGSRDTILSEFYERALADQPPSVRKFVEDEMLTESGFRENLAEERVAKAFAAGGAPPDALATLVNRRLLRIEERLDLRRVELTHDVLCSVVKASREARHEREARDEAERQLAAQRARERATRKALVRARQVAAVCAVLAIGAVVGAIFGYIGMKRAQKAEFQAQATQSMAESARGESEKLVVYLLDDFYLELAPVGRLDIVGGLAKRAVDYYSGLPQPLRTTQTERNRALALVRYGSVLRIQSRMEEARKVIDEAVKALGQMRAEGDNSETTAIGLALGLTTQARIASLDNLEGEALKAASRAVDVLKPLATAPDASVALRRTYGEALDVKGDRQWRIGANEEAVATLEEARATLRDLQTSDLTSAAIYAEASSWELYALAQLGRSEDARRVGGEGLAVAAQVLEKRPGHMQALRAQTLAAGPLALLLRGEMRLAEALAMSESAERGWKEFVRLDPGNTVSWGNLAVEYRIKNEILQQMGRPADAAATLRAGLEEVDGKSPPSLRVQGNLSLLAGLLGALEANRGNAKQSDEAIALVGKWMAYRKANAPPGFESELLAPEQDSWRTLSAQLSGDYGRALDTGRLVVARLEQIKPADEGQRRLKDIWLRVTRFTLAQSAYALGDYATAEREMMQVLEVRQHQPWPDLGDKREIAFEKAFAALVLARLDRQAEAQKMISPVLEFERALSPRNRDDPTQRYQLAVALYVASVAGVGNVTTQLAEAGALMDKLPPEMRSLHDLTVWRERVAEEQKKRR
jgi:tetratricopeptide (TPR) repeat protein